MERDLFATRGGCVLYPCAWLLTGQKLHSGVKEAITEASMHGLDYFTGGHWPTAALVALIAFANGKSRNSAVQVLATDLLRPPAP